jgi:DNA-binding PadR family transcriptional regulator
MLNKMWLGDYMKLVVLEYLSKNLCASYDELRKLFVAHNNDPGNVYSVVSKLVSDGLVEKRGDAVCLKEIEARGAKGVIAVVLEHLKSLRDAGKPACITYEELKKLLEGYGYSDLYGVVSRMVRKGLVVKVYSEMRKQKVVCLADEAKALKYLATGKTV